jgi:hypothetical protein
MRNLFGLAGNGLDGMTGHGMVWRGIVWSEYPTPPRRFLLFGICSSDDLCVYLFEHSAS